jgi:hypothetical protein
MPRCGPNWAAPESVNDCAPALASTGRHQQTGAALGMLRRFTNTAAHHMSARKPSDAASPAAWTRRVLEGLGLARAKASRAGESAGATVPPGSKAPQPVDVSGANLRRAHAALTARFDVHPDARRLAPHLAEVEYQIGRHGRQAFRRLPPAFAERALAQVNKLFGDRPDDALRTVRQQLRERAKAASTQDVRPEMHVAEASHSQFDEAERSWVGQVPTPGNGTER